LRGGVYIFFSFQILILESDSRTDVDSTLSDQVDLNADLSPKYIRLHYILILLFLFYAKSKLITNKKENDHRTKHLLNTEKK
jgi:hypothetical protein